MSAYNAQMTIATAIESILDQTYSDIEFLIADDGSADRTRRIIDDYKNRDPRILCYHNAENIGLLHTWNRLMHKATGEFIAWQDADDYSYPERLEKMVEAFQNDPDLMICGCNYLRVLQPWDIKITSNFPQTHDALIREVRTKRRLLFLGGTRMMRSQLLDEFPEFRGFFDRIGWEDNDFILRVAEKYKVSNLPDVLYRYNYSRNSASRIMSEKIYLKIFVNDIGFFLADQRQRDGVDGLMDGGNKTEFDDYIQLLRDEYNRDKSIVYRKSCLNKVNNRDYFFAVQDALQAIGVNKINPNNYSLLLRVMGSFGLFILKQGIRKI